jgi:hypothetical protein
MTVDDTTKQQLLAAVRAARRAMEDAARRVLDAQADQRRARSQRGQAVTAADDAGIDRDEIAKAAGIDWPVSSGRWSQIRAGKNAPKSRKS